MIFAVSEMMGSPDEYDGGIAAAAEVHESGGGSGGSTEMGASISIPGGGIRWPSKETLALLKIRSEMDSVFRDASHKAPLWEEVSRKMGEIGFQRSAKKCREKFENVYKYHKRTKDGRASKPSGKTYRFFEELEALENKSFAAVSPPRNLPPVTFNNTNPYTASLPISPTPLSALPPNLVPSRQQLSSTPFQRQVTPPPPSFLHFSNSMSSSSTSSDEDIQRRRGRKRKWKDYLEMLMREVITKQEEMQKRFLETVEKRERDRISRAEAWRVQEMVRLNREHELLVQERSVAATKDAAIVAFLQKITDQHQNLSIPVSFPLPPFPPIPTQEQPSPAPIRQPQLEIPELGTGTATETREENVGGSSAGGSSSRWPKTEVLALIKLRTDLCQKYIETAPKGPLWEEISGAMAKLGYNRSAKRCKEKWENINKYYKKVKESNKKRPEDAKTCPYFHQLEAIYKQKVKNDDPMAGPEHQWPPSEQNPVQNQDDLELDDDDDADENDDDGIPNPPPVNTTE